MKIHICLSVFLLLLAVFTASSDDVTTVIQNGHVGSVFGVAYSPDGSFIASGSGSGEVKLWSTKGGLIRTLEGPSIESIAFSPDGKYIVGGTSAGTMLLWSVEGRHLRTFEIPARVRSVAVSPDGRYVAASGTRTIAFKLWSVDGRLIYTAEGDGGITGSLAFSPNGKFIASSSDNIALWSVEGEFIRTYDVFPEMPTGVAFSPDGKYIVSGYTKHQSEYGEAEMRLWSVEGDQIRTFGRQSRSVRSLAFSPDGKHIASGSTGGEVELWSLEGNLVRTFTGHTDEVTSVAFSPDGRFIASGSLDDSVRIWSLKGESVQTMKGYSSSVHCLALDPDREHIASGSEDGSVKLWAIDGELGWTHHGHTKRVTSVSYSPDGRYIASSSWDGTVKLWSEDGEMVRTFTGSFEEVRSTMFSPDGRYIAIDSENGGLFLFTVDGRLIRTLKKVGHSIAFSPEWKYIASARNMIVKLCSLDGELVRTIDVNSNVFDISFSPDGRYIAVGSWDYDVKLWSVDGELVRSYDHSKLAWCVSFSPDGKYIAGGLDDGSVKLWSIEGKPLWASRGHANAVNDLSFSSDGRYLISCSFDTTIKIWNIETGESVSLVGFRTDEKSSWEWIMYTDDGYFDCSPDGSSIVAVRKGMEVFGIDQFAVQKNRPDVILERLGLGTEEQRNHYYLQYIKRLIRLGFLPESIPKVVVQRDIFPWLKDDRERSFFNSCYTLLGSEYRLSRKLSFGEKYRLFSQRAFVGYVEKLLQTGLHVPEAEITEIKQDGKRAELRFTVKDSLYNLARYNIYINGVPLYGSYWREITGREQRIVEKIELGVGKNRVEVSCMNEKAAESYRDMTTVSYEGVLEKDLYFIGFGVSKYTNPALALLYPSKDVRDLQRLFSEMKGHFKSIHTMIYTDTRCTVGNIKKAKSFLSRAKVDDTVVLFISGHGLHDTDPAATYYFLTYETDLDNLSQTAANFELIEGILQGIAPRNKLFLMDTCESGELAYEKVRSYLQRANRRGFRARTFPGYESGETSKGLSKGLATRGNREYLLHRQRFIFSDLFRRSGAIVFSSSRGGEYSYEPGEYSERGNGFFTQAVLESLRTEGVDKNNDKMVTTDEMREYVREAVSERTDGLQNPTVDRDNIHMNKVVGFPLMK